MIHRSKEVILDYTTVQIENLVETAIMGGSDFAKLDGIESVRTIRATMSLQLYIICDNGDIIQMIYEFGTRKICATLVGMHCSNDALIPVCMDEYDRDELISSLMDAASYPVLPSEPSKQGAIYPFLHTGHVVYSIVHELMDIHTVKCLFRRIAEDVICLHKDGTLLEIAHMRVDRIHRKVTKEWVLC